MPDPDRARLESEPARYPGLTGAQLRRAAKRRVLRRRLLQGHLVLYGLVSAFLVTIWAIFPTGVFWPVFPIFGWGIVVAYHAWFEITAGRTEQQVQAEMRRIVGE